MVISALRMLALYMRFNVTGISGGETMVMDAIKAVMVSRHSWC